MSAGSRYLLNLPLRAVLSANAAFLDVGLSQILVMGLFPSSLPRGRYFPGLVCCFPFFTYGKLALSFPAPACCLLGQMLWQRDFAPLVGELSIFRPRSRVRCFGVVSSTCGLSFIPFRSFIPFHSIPFHSIPSIPFLSADTLGAG